MIVSHSVEPAGENPATVGASAPCSRPRTGEETPTSERGIESLQAARPGRERVRGPNDRESQQPRERYNRKGAEAEPIMSRRRQQTASEGRVVPSRGVPQKGRGDRVGAAQDSAGV